jgi:septal ring factor EnvC (AmiA/AmiB activator)
MVKKDRAQSLRSEIEELREEAAALADRAKRTARQAEILVDRIKDLEKQVIKKRPSHTVAKTAGEDFERAASRLLAQCGSWLDALENYVARRTSP